MKINDKLCGFTVKRIAAVAELSATLYEMEHDKTGALLAYLDRKDENMSFAISFATPPEDDTGVFHIIEHSVLCGSEKYPLRDPFAELLKGSLNTFLNALTYEDRTVYPVSSRCERDFLNLVDVYLDATLRPNLKKNPAIFRQEGWHYEYDGERLTRSGVVYNEMKGAYSSPDDLAMAEMNRALFGDGSYGRDSGGDPEAIPTLTYERVLYFHDKYYHPSNAQIFLDGSLDIEKTLSLIDEHISRYEKRNICAECVRSEPVIARRSVSYEISESEDAGERVRVLFGYVFSKFSEQEELLATSLLCDYLCGSNAAPLKRSLLEAGLCRDAAMYTNRCEDQTVILELRDTSEEKLSEIESFVEERIRELAKKGLDKDSLTAALDLVEFKYRERDYGSFPSGVAFALSAFGSWRYGAAPEAALSFEETVKNVREKIKGDYFEKTLLKMTVDNPHRAVLTMLPDAALAEKRAKEEEAELGELLAKMSPEELERIKRQAEELKAWQEGEESEEARATIPTLAISDIPKASERPDVSASTECGCEALHIKADTNGISYVNLFFDASDMKPCELWQLSLLSNLLTNLDTTAGDALSLQNRIKASLGNLSVATSISVKDGVTTPYLRLSASALDTKKDKLIEIIREVLLCSDFNNPKEIENTIAQSKSAYEDAVLSSGHSASLNRIEAYFSLRGTYSEYMSGYEAYLKLKELCEDKVAQSALPSSLAVLAKKLITKSRLTLSLAGEADGELITRLADMLPQGEGAVRAEAEPLGPRREFILVPTKVAYATAGAVVKGADGMLGALRVARNILSYEYLWTTVRMAGGAYGAGFVPRRSGLVAFYSYRDPSPLRTLGCFADSASYLRSLAASEADLTKFIIGAMGEYDILTTPQSAAAIALSHYMNGVTKKQNAQERESLLSCDGASLLRIAGLIDEAMESDCICIVGGKEHLASCKKKIDKVLYL